ncbi:unnamed protein product [Protopolystoma xenopodis]|uniref:Uncharacterized protein n=1 Tax=Protopolystoma xenopodis TaxID=117903 RepID=A0A448XLZ3_9PLAT|nr:unnamed protein product [Protopolystoma xenopodis]
MGPPNKRPKGKPVCSFEPIDTAHSLNPSACYPITRAACRRHFHSADGPLFMADFFAFDAASRCHTSRQWAVSACGGRRSRLVCTAAPSSCWAHHLHA